jgi:hypothetical protein
MLISQLQSLQTSFELDEGVDKTSIDNIRRLVELYEELKTVFTTTFDEFLDRQNLNDVDQKINSSKLKQNPTRALCDNATMVRHGKPLEKVIKFPSAGWGIICSKCSLEVGMYPGIRVFGGKASVSLTSVFASHLIACRSLKDRRAFYRCLACLNGRQQADFTSAFALEAHIMERHHSIDLDLDLERTDISLSVARERDKFLGVKSEESYSGWTSSNHPLPTIGSKRISVAIDINESVSYSLNSSLKNNQDAESSSSHVQDKDSVVSKCTPSDEESIGEPQFKENVAEEPVDNNVVSTQKNQYESIDLTGEAVIQTKSESEELPTSSRSLDSSSGSNHEVHHIELPAEDLYQDKAALSSSTPFEHAHELSATSVKNDDADSTKDLAGKTEQTPTSDIENKTASIKHRKGTDSTSNTKVTTYDEQRYDNQRPGQKTTQVSPELVHQNSSVSSQMIIPKLESRSNNQPTSMVTDIAAVPIHSHWIRSAENRYLRYAGRFPHETYDENSIEMKEIPPLDTWIYSPVGWAGNDGQKFDFWRYVTASRRHEFSNET